MQKNESSISVCHIASGDLWGGAEAQLLTLATTQQESPDIRVSVLLMNDGELARRLRAANIAVECLDEASTGGLGLLTQIMAYLRRNRPDVVHSHRQKENVLSSIANLLSIKAKSVRTQHGAAEFQLSMAQKIADKLDVFVGRYLQQQVIAVSADLRVKLLDTFPCSHICTILNGVDPESIKRKAQSHQAPLDGKTAAQNIGIVGRLTPVKRVDLFLDIAATQASKQRFFHIFGDGALFDTLQQKADTINQSLGYQAVFLHGHRDDIASCIAALDCLVMCSDHEGLPMTLMESCALGVPVVAHKIGGIPEIISTAQGLLVEQHTADAYAEAINQVLAAPEKYRNMPFPKGFSAQDNERAVAALYRQILET